jgi:hypothetical protein
VTSTRGFSTDRPHDGRELLPVDHRVGVELDETPVCPWHAEPRLGGAFRSEDVEHHRDLVGRPGRHEFLPVMPDELAADERLGGRVRLEDERLAVVADPRKLLSAPPLGGSRMTCLAIAPSDPSHAIGLDDGVRIQSPETERQAFRVGSGMRPRARFT